MVIYVDIYQGLFVTRLKPATATETAPHFVVSFLAATLATEQRMQKLWRSHHEAGNQAPIFSVAIELLAVVGKQTGP